MKSILRIVLNQIDVLVYSKEAAVMANGVGRHPGTKHYHLHLCEHYYYDYIDKSEHN